MDINSLIASPFFNFASAAITAIILFFIFSKIYLKRMDKVMELFEKLQKNTVYYQYIDENINLIRTIVDTVKTSKARSFYMFLEKETEIIRINMYKNYINGSDYNKAVNFINEARYNIVKILAGEMELKDSENRFMCLIDFIIKACYDLCIELNKLENPQMKITLLTRYIQNIINVIYMFQIREKEFMKMATDEITFTLFYEFRKIDSDFIKEKHIINNITGI